MRWCQPRSFKKCNYVLFLHGLFFTCLWCLSLGKNLVSRDGLFIVLYGELHHRSWNAGINSINPVMVSWWFTQIAANSTQATGMDIWVQKTVAQIIMQRKIRKQAWVHQRINCPQFCCLFDPIRIVLTHLQGFAVGQTSHYWHLCISVVDLSAQRKILDNYTTLFSSRLQWGPDLAQLPWQSLAWSFLVQSLLDWALSWKQRHSKVWIISPCPLFISFAENIVSTILPVQCFENIHSVVYIFWKSYVPAPLKHSALAPLNWQQL